MGAVALALSGFIALGLSLSDAEGSHKLRVATTIPILVQPWNDLKLAQRVAEEAGARAVVIPTMVGGAKGVDTHIGTIEHNVTALAQALR